MSSHDVSEITLLLAEIQQGSAEAREQLIPLIYQEMRKMAQSFLGPGGKDRTLQATALVHETYLKLFGKENPKCQDRAHFFALAGRVMRHIVVDYTRAAGAQKRNGSQIKLALSLAPEISVDPNEEIFALDEALGRLEESFPRVSRIVELRFFCGFTEEEIVDLLGISLATVKRDWAFGRAWLYDQLRSDGARTSADRSGSASKSVPANSV